MIYNRIKCNIMENRLKYKKLLNYEILLFIIHYFHYLQL